MNTLVIIIASFDDVEKVANIKQNILNYVGTRMVEENVANYPIIVLNSNLTTMDKENLASFIKDENMMLQFVETAELPHSHECFTSLISNSYEM